MGQFLSVDPMVATTGQAYAYTGDDPVNDVNPLRLCPRWICGALHAALSSRQPSWNIGKWDPQ